jgi:predicted RNA binding protein YcfA (HicA-like mRNA interferase family)
MTLKTGNVSIKDLKKVLLKLGCKEVGINSGHIKYVRADLTRPIIFQTHIDPVPRFIIQQIIRTLSLDKKAFEKLLKGV